MEIIYLIPLTTALVEVLKKAGGEKTQKIKHLFPLVSVFVGVIIVMAFTDLVMIERVLYGLLVGLTASGVYDFAEMIVKK